MTDSQPQLDRNGVEWIRVRDKETGHHYSVSVVDPDIHQELKQPALDANGSPLPPKPRVESARSTTASADTKEK
jgi:hypothetical protein